LRPHDVDQIKSKEGKNMIILLLVYLFVGIVVYVVTDTRTVASEIESRNLLVTFGDVSRFLMLFSSR